MRQRGHGNHYAHCVGVACRSIPKKLNALCSILVENESELRADLQRYYGIDLDHALNGGHTPWHIACLVEHLPPESSLHVAYNQDAVWTLTDTLLATLVNSLNLLIWSMGSKNKRGQRPQLIGPTYMRNKTRTLDAQAMPIEELMQKLNLPRG